MHINLPSNSKENLTGHTCPSESRDRKFHSNSQPYHSGGESDDRKPESGKPPKQLDELHNMEL